MTMGDLNRMTDSNPYQATQAELLDVDDDAGLPSGWKRAWMSLACSYGLVLPILAYTASSTRGSFGPLSELILMSFWVLFGGSVVILPSWFVVFLPVVLTVDPRSHWARSSRLAVFGALVGGAWGLILIAGTTDEVMLVFVLACCGAMPGFFYGSWNRLFLQRKSHA
jgi:hypothetical protein